MKKRFTTSTPKGTEGINISYSDEKKCAESLLKKLPPEWKIHFDWFQVFFYDVAYKIDRKKKKIEIGYNKSLSYWWPTIEKDILKNLS